MSRDRLGLFVLMAILMALVSCAPASVKADGSAAVIVGEYLGRTTAEDGNGPVSLWRYRHEGVTCYLTKGGYSGGISCLKDAP